MNIKKRNTYSLPLMSVLLMLAVAMNSTAQQTATAEKGDLEMTVHLPGVFIADDKDEIKVEPNQYSGDLIVTRILPEGVTVKKGDVLMAFDAAQVEEKIEEAQNEATDAEVALKKADAQLQSAKIDLESKTAQAVVELRHLQLEIESAKEEQVLEIEKKEKAIVSSEYDLAQQKLDFETLKQIYEERQVDTTAKSGDILIAREVASIEKARKSIQYQKRQLEYFKKFDQSKDQLDKELAVEKKNAEIKKQEIKLNADVADKQAAMDKAQRKFDSAKKKVDGLIEDRSQLQITSPRDGVVFYGSTGSKWPAGYSSSSDRDTKKELRIGGRLKTHSVLLTIASMERLSIKIKVDEGDIQHLEQGLKTTIHPDAFPNEEFQGELTKVGQFATGGLYGTTKKTFNVMARCTEPATQLRSGMNCRVAIHCKPLGDAILVPVNSVFSDGSEYVCYVKKGDDVEKRVVQIGLSNASFAELKSGVEAGEKVCLQIPDDENGS